MKETFYFSHDYNACRDPKIIKLLNKFSWSGYGMYWRIIEILHEQEGKISNDDFADMLVFELRIDEKLCKEFTDFLIRIKLLSVSDDGKFITSSRVIKNLAFKQQRKEILIENGKKGGRPKTKTKPNDNQAETKTKPIGFENETKNNHIKLNEIKRNEIKQKERNKDTNFLSFSSLIFSCKDKEIELSKDEIISLSNQYQNIDVKSKLESYSNYLNKDDAKKPLSNNFMSRLKSKLNEWNLEKSEDELPEMTPEDIEHHKKLDTAHERLKAEAEANRLKVLEMMKQKDLK